MSETEKQKQSPLVDLLVGTATYLLGGTFFLSPAYDKPTA